MGTNDDLLAPLASENFANDDALGTVSVTATTISTNTGPAVFAISYGASSGSYTVTQGALTQTFRTSDIDQTQSDDTQTTYKRVTGSTTEFLTLVKNGTETGLTRYVGAGVWQRVTEGADTGEARFNAFTYGVQTPDESMPKTGAASFDVTLLGVRNFQTFAYAMGGSGRLSIDFSTGAIAGQGFYDEFDLSSGAGGNQGYDWKAYAMLTADTNNFAGKINLGSAGPGGLQGSFYGPAADEVGAVWWTGIPGSDGGSVGAIYGKRGTYPINQATQIGSPENDVFFTTTSTSVKAALDGSGILSDADTNAGVKAVFLPAVGGNPVFYRSGSDIPQPAPGVGDLSYQLFTYPGEYFRSGMMLDQRNGSAVLDSFIYGFNTQSADMPLTGTAYYYTLIEGGLLANGQKLQVLQGDGRLVADFTTGEISASGQYTTYIGDPATGLAGSTPNTATDTGTYSGTAQISSSGFAGSLDFDGTNDYSGAMNGQFYGPHSEEVGAVFQASGSGAQLSGYLTGGRDDNVSGAFSTLADLGGATRLTSLTAQVWLADPQPHLQLGNKDFDVFYDPTSDAARLAIVERGEAADYSYELARVGTGNYSAADSTAAQQVYRYANNHYGKPNGGTETDYKLVDYVFDGQGGRIELTYTGFAATYGKQQDNGFDVAYFTPYGVGTPYALRPLTGSASYSGIAVGRGAIRDDEPGTDPIYDLTGTSSMAVNFGTAAFTGSIDLTGTNIADSTIVDFGSYNFAGTVGLANYGASGSEGFGFAGTENGSNYDGVMYGSFFGPEAQEYGGLFDLQIDGANGINGFARGGFAGKKD